MTANEQNIDQTQQYINELQRITDHLTIKKKLRWGGIGGILSGGFTLLGFLFMFLDPDPLYGFTAIDALVLLVGAVLFFKGIQLLKNPKPSDLIFEGVLLIAVGVWGIIWMVLVLTSDNPNPDDIFINIVPLFQIAWGCGMIAQHKRFKNASAAGADKELLKKIMQMIKDVKRAKPKKCDDIIEFKSKTGMRALRWKGRLSEPFSMFVERRGEDALFLQKHDIIFEPFKKVLKKQYKKNKILKFRVVLGPRQLVAQMRAKYFYRFKEWKKAQEYVQ